MSDHEAKQATPHATLLVELLDSRIPKSEREHAAAREIELLTAERDELRRQLAEAKLDARRYRWLAGHCRSTSEHWGGRWSIIVDGPAPKVHDSEDAFDAAIDAAMRLTRPAEE